MIMLISRFDTSERLFFMNSGHSSPVNNKSELAPNFEKLCPLKSHFVSHYFHVVSELCFTSDTIKNLDDEFF